MAMPGLSEIPSEVIRKAVCETIEDKIKSKNYKVSVSSASKAGESNFVGIVYRVLYEKEDSIDAKPQESSLIVKVAPQNLARRDQFYSQDIFLQEIYMYDEVLPFLRQFEESKRVTGEDGFNKYPKCYRTVKDEFSECLLLEDLNVRGFDIIDRYTEEVTADHVHLILKSMAKFHAISFALNDQQPEKFLKLASKLQETFFRDGNLTIRNYMDQKTEDVRKLLSAKDDAYLLARIDAVFNKPSFEILHDCVRAESGTVIAHGDTWQNNILFKYDKNGKPIDIYILDWQVSRHSSPIIDIVYFIFCCTTKELRDAHYDAFLKVYHKHLSAHIRRLGSDPEKLYPYSLMLDHFRKFGKYGLLMATLLLPIILADKGQGVDLDEATNNSEHYKDTEISDPFFITESSRSKFKKRLRDVVVDMVRLGYI